MMHARLLAFVIVIITFCSSPARAQDIRVKIEAAFGVSYLIAGGSSIPGGHAPATGGAALVPTGRILLTLPIADLYLAASPIVVTPWTLDALAIVGALDLGAAWHPSSRSWTLGTGATIAPAYMRFCNETWCLKEGVALYGAEAHFSGRVLQQEDGRGLSGELSARVLTGRPTAWYWPRLTEEEAAVNHLMGTLGGDLIWRW